MLLDNQRLLSQIVQLQHETGKMGRDRVVKMRGAYDDLANAACGALVYAQERIARRVPRPIYAETVGGNYRAL